MATNSSTITSTSSSVSVPGVIKYAYTDYAYTSVVCSPRQEASKQLSDYIALINSPTFETKPMSQSIMMEFPLLNHLFARIFCVPASSAPVERYIFPQSGIMMRPHRAKMSDLTLETLMFLKCNSHLSE